MVREQLETFNVSDFVLNTTLIDNSSELVQNIASNADPASAGWFGLTVMLIIYVFTTYQLYRDDEVFRLDFVRASLYGSGFALGVGIIMFSLGWISNYRHLLWVGLIYLISYLSAWGMKNK